MHNDFDKRYPIGTKVREDKVASLKKNLNGQQSVFHRLLSSSNCATEASVKISWVLAKKQKPYSDGETVKLLNYVSKKVQIRYLLNLRTKMRSRNKYQIFNYLTRQ